MESNSPHVLLHVHADHVHSVHMHAVQHVQQLCTQQTQHATSPLCAIPKQN